MDVDTTSTKGAHETLLTRFRNKEADVLLGTQMVAKGLDFPDVTLVGVIAADTVLHLPDFRASERTFQLLTQVAGRAGRHQLPGEVIIQTYHPEHYSIVHAQEHDFRAFVEKEKGLREKLAYPPYCELALVTFSHKVGQKAIAAAHAFVELVRGEVGGATLTFLGPVPAPLAKIKDRYRMQILIKYPMESSAVLSVALSHAGMEIDRGKSFGDLQVVIDVQPQMLM
jgi:primosomal protein N' (replication factor Y)